MHLTSSTHRLAACAAFLAALPLVVGAQSFGGSRDRPKPIVVEVGVIHPVESEPIQDGVLVIDRGTIRAMGKRGEVEVPEGATIFEFRGAHAYPGLIDAQSAAFCARSTLQAAGGDAGSKLEDALDYRDSLSRNLASYGITTSYVASRAQSRWRGIGAYVRSMSRGGRAVRDAPDAAVHMSLTAAPGTHALDRAEKLRDVGKPFEALEAYEKSRKKFDKAVGKYEDEFDEYIEYHEKQQGETKGSKDKGEKGGNKPASKPKAAPPKPGTQDNDKPEDGGDKNGDEKPGADKPKPGKGGDAESQPDRKESNSGRRSDKRGKSDREGGKSDKGDDKAPKRPTYPKEPTQDPAKDALIAVRDGKRSLRVEARRVEEIRTAIELKTDCAIDSMILEGADAAASVADELAKAGIPVVVTRVEPQQDSPYGADDVIADNLRRLHDAGVKIAIGSGDTRRARNLPLIAARAAALGLGVDAAVRAITLDAAQILGLDDRVGSLAPNKIADIVITSGPLLASQSQILQVLVGGRPILDSD